MQGKNFKSNEVNADIVSTLPLLVYIYLICSAFKPDVSTSTLSGETSLCVRACVLGDGIYLYCV